MAPPEISDKPAGGLPDGPVPPSGPTAPITLADRAYDQLLGAIVSGEIGLGEKLRESSLARRFGVGRGPLREAIRRLEERRLVTHTAHVGARVVQLSNEALLELFHLREAIEGVAARLAATRMSDDEIGEVSALLDAQEAMLDDRESLDQSTHDVDFHYRIARGSHSDLVEGILCRDLYQLLQLYRRRHSAVPGRVRRALVEHRGIVNAVAERDAELAEILMRRHVAAARRNVERMMNEENGRQAPVEDDRSGDRI